MLLSHIGFSISRSTKHKSQPAEALCVQSVADCILRGECMTTSIIHSHSIPSQVQSYLTAAEPFRTLPRLLIPSRALVYKPPLMYYGWRAPRDTLLAYAKKSKITGNLSRRKLSVLERMIFGMIAINEGLGRPAPGDMMGIHMTVLGNQETWNYVFTVYSKSIYLRRMRLSALGRL